MVTKEGDTGRLYPQVPIDVLPNNVFLELFEFYLGKDDPDEFGYGHNYDAWQTLVHVCRRWRDVMFASPHRLDLKLYCTRQRSVNSKTLEIWPELPIVIDVEDVKSKEDVANIIAALRHHNRVCKIQYYNGHFQNSLLEEFAAIDEPFPALTCLMLISHAQNVPVLPDSFLGGSAPRLRSLELEGIPYPSIGKLLSSTTNLVWLSLLGIPHSGYISPETIVPCLSMLPKLELLQLGFRYPRSRAHRASRHPPPLTRVISPNLNLFQFQGNVEYLEDILSQIETPMLNRSRFRFFNQIVFDTPLLGNFICRTETFMTTHTAHVEFYSSAVQVNFSKQETAHNDVEIRSLSILCNPLDRQLSALPQVLNSFLPSLSTLESLEIAIDHEDWQGEIEVIQWQEFLHPFTAVKKMTLKDEASVRLVVPALQELAGGGATEVLPALQNLSFTTSGWSPPGPLKEAIEEFVATRQLCGQPVILHYQDPKSEV